MLALHTALNIVAIGSMHRIIATDSGGTPTVKNRQLKQIVPPQGIDDFAIDIISGEKYSVIG